MQKITMAANILSQETLEKYMIQTSINNRDYDSRIIFSYKIYYPFLDLHVCVCVCIFILGKMNKTRRNWGYNHKAGNAKHFEHWFCKSHILNQHKQVPVSSPIIH